MSWSKWGCTLRHQETADEQMMKTAYFLTATFPQKPPHFFASGIILFPNSPAHLLVSWRILIWNLERAKRKSVKPRRKRHSSVSANCIQPSKPTDRLYKSQAADGPLFRLIDHFRLLLRNQAQFRRLEGARLRHRVFRAVQAVQNQIAEERAK